MQPEHRIICLGARTALDEAAEAELRALLAGSVDWERLRVDGRHHEVLPLLLASLRPRAGSATIPAGWLEQAERTAAATLIRNLALAEELARVLEALQQAGLEPIPIKGVVLAETVYGGLSLRPAADVDVLLEPQEHAVAGRVLALLGYVQSDVPDFTTAHHPFHDTYYRESSAGAVCLELHSALWDPHLFRPLHGVWERAVAAELRGVRARLLAPEDGLLHLAIHRSQSPLRLRFLCDVAELVRSRDGELDWDAILARAETVRARTALFASLLLARDLLGAPVPESCLEHLGVGGLKRRLLERTCGARALFHQAPLGDPGGLDPLRRRALRTLEQDGAPHMGWALVRGSARKVRERRYERRRLARQEARAGLTR